MRILFLSTWFPYPPDNGSKLRAYHLLRSLGERHSVTLCSFTFGTARPDRSQALSEICERVEVLEANPFRRSRRQSALRFLSPAPIADKPLPAMVRLTRNLSAEQSFDVAVASTTVMSTYALLSGAACQVLEEHNFHTLWRWEQYLEQTSPVQRFRTWVSWRKRQRYDAALFNQFDLCTMVSDPDLDAVRRMLPGVRSRVEMLTNGVDCQHHRPGLFEATPNTLVYSGALTYYSNYDAMEYFLGEIMPHVRREVPGATLAITGSTRGVDLDRLPLNGHTRLTGYVEDVREEVAGASVCVVPLRKGGGTRIKMRTAELLQSPALRQRLSANARRLVEEQYDWAHIGQRFVALVEEVAARCGARSR